MSFSLRLTALLGALLLAVGGCTPVTVSHDNLSCDHGTCPSGYVCHPESGLCVAFVPIACDGNGACPATTETGDSCSTPGSFLPCASTVSDCSRGCRTCSPDRTWSACSVGTCARGIDTACADCRDDCTVLPHIGVGACVATRGSSRCRITSCADGWYDLDGVPENGCEADCVPTNDGIEMCDGLDNDCDGIVDEEDAAGCSPYFADVDGDAYGTEGRCLCAPAASYTATVGGDCDDTRPDVHPGATEVCDDAHTDEDCNGLADNDDPAAAGKLTYYPDGDHDGFGDALAASTLLCPQPASWVTNNDDCDDGNDAVHPGAAEVCNHRDDDCDGLVDGGLGTSCHCADGSGPLPAELCGNGIDDDCNGSVDDGCCTAADTFTLDLGSARCAGGPTDVPVMHLRASSTCRNQLTALTITRHSNSTSADTALTNIRLYHDKDLSGGLTEGDELLAGPMARMDGNSISFTSVGLTLEPGTSGDLIVVADRGSYDSYFAGEVTSSASFAIIDQNSGKRLAAARLTGGVHSLAAPRCGAADGTQPILSAQRWSIIGAGWQTASEAGWYSGGVHRSTDTADCNLETPSIDLWTRDRGNSGSAFLHLDTGVPRGLPTCGLHLRVHDSKYYSGTCSNQSFADHDKVYMYSYTLTNTTVVAASETVADLTGAVTPGSPTPGHGCANDSIDVDITPLYQFASGAGSFNIRFIPEGGGGLGVDDGTVINSFAEIYVYGTP